MNEKDSKIYIGDAVYVERTPYDIVLTTEDGIAETNRIVLEPRVLQDFLEFIEPYLPRYYARSSKMTKMGFKVTVEMLVEDDDLEEKIRKLLEKEKDYLDDYLESNLGDLAGLKHLAWSIEYDDMER